LLRKQSWLKVLQNIHKLQDKWEASCQREARTLAGVLPFIRRDSCWKGLLAPQVTTLERTKSVTYN
jgi:hypothetical protein